MASIDPRSDRIALFYTGGDDGVPNVAGVPARDLTEGDVARLVYIERVSKVQPGEDAPGELTGAAADAAHGALMDRLADTGVYRRTDPDKTRSRRHVDEDALTPEQPADPPVTPAPAPVEG